MVIGLLLLWAVSAGAAPPSPSLPTLRWAPVPTRPGDRTAERRIAQVRGDRPLRAQCGAEEVPRRQAVYEGALVDGAFSVPVRDESGWVFPPGPASVDAWVVTPPDCSLYALETSITPEAAAHLEWHREVGDVLATLREGDALDPDEIRWLAPNPDDASAWATLRPPGPHSPGWTTWRADGDAAFTIRGPRRLYVAARWLDVPREVCLAIDGQPACRSAVPEERWAYEEGSLVRVPARDRPVGKALIWRVLLPDGPHEVTVDGPAEVRISGTWPTLYARDARAVSPAETLVEPSPVDAERAVVRPDRSQGSLLLFGATEGPVTEEDVRWLPLDSPALAGAERLDAPGVLTLYLKPEGDGPCTVRFPEGPGWTAFPTEAVHRFLWTGADPPDAPPSVQGCAARVRVTGVSAVPDAWAASRWWWVRARTAATWSQPTPEGRLWIRHPSDRTRPYRVRIQHPSGRVEHWTVAPRGAPPNRWTERGEAWQPSLSIPLDPGTGPVEVWADAPVLTRISALSSPSSEGSDPSPVAPAPVSGDLHALTRAIAAAGDDAARAGALVDRAWALSALGEDRLAWADWQRAADLAPARLGNNPFTDRVARGNARLLFGSAPPRWVPGSASWVPEDAPPDAVARARLGDWLGVAEQIRTAGGDARPWWREAVTEGQVLTADQRLAAYRDLAVHTDPSEVDDPWLWPLRLSSQWERVHQVRGSESRSVRLPLAPTDEVDLFPEPWPEPEVLPVVEGFEAQVPGAGGRDLAVRCRVTRIDSAAQGCRFRAFDATGALLAQITTDPWGTAGALPIPARAGTVYVGVKPDRGVEAQVRQPSGTARDRQRTAWPLWAGGMASFDVLGPTVLRLETWRSDPGSAMVTVEQRAPGFRALRTEHPLPDKGEVLVPIDIEGPVEVRVRPSVRSWIVPSIRVPRDTSRPPQSDRDFLAAGSPPGGADPPAEASIPAPWTPPTGRPVRDPPLTVVLRSGLGNAIVDDPQPEPAVLPSLRGFMAVGLASRPVEEPLWFELEARGDLSESGPQLGVNGFVQWLAVRRTWQLWVIGEGRWVRGWHPLAPLATAQGRLQVRAGAWPWRHWELQGRVTGTARGIVAGGWDPFAYGPDMVRLWSSYKEDHRGALEVEARARYRELPWLDVTLSTWLETNEDFVQPPESFGVRAWAEGGMPLVWWRAGADVEHRFPDRDRNFGYWSPSVFARAAVNPWPDRDLGLQVRASARYRFYFEDFLALLELRVYGNRDRALADVPPTRIAEAHLLEWYQEGAAQRRQAHVEEVP